MLGELDPCAGQADGFLPRILFGWPDPMTPLWSDRAITPNTLQVNRTLFAQLVALEYNSQQGGIPLVFTQMLRGDLFNGMINMP